MPQSIDPEQLYQRMLEVANEDGIISEDEQALIDNVRANISKYFQILRDSFEDKIITEEEQYEMYESRKRILEEALQVAKGDEKITQDEFKLLSTIREILQEMEYNENY